MNKNNEINEIKKTITPILKKCGVKKAAIFGSVAESKNNKESDLDIIVEFLPDKSLLNLVKLKQELEKVLKRKVDLVTYQSIHPFLRNKILNQQKPIF